MKKTLLLIVTLLLSLSMTACSLAESFPFLEDILGGESEQEAQKNPSGPISLDNIPAFDGKTPYVIINDNLPFFTEEEMTAESFESYAELDTLGRCGVTVASIGKDIMPTEERGSIGMVKPSGWHTVKYDIVNGKYLYNRCHLIGFQLAGENANEKNLITGTRFMNVDGMLPFEDMVADYVKETNNHVMYRVTPIYDGNNLVANGVLMEAKSVEDGGDGILFCVYVYNNQPGIVINYATGESKLDDGTTFPEEEPDKAPDGDGTEGDGTEVGTTYILNTSTMKFHTPECHYAESMSEANRDVFVGTAEELITAGYDDCGTCKPK